MTTVGRRGRPRDEVGRQRIAQAGQKLFVQHGYVATTVGDVATEAQVSVQTIYSAYHSKVGVLKAAHDVAIGGDEVRPLLERDWAQQLSQMAAVQEAWTTVVEQVALVTAQVAPIYAVIQRASADPDVALLLEELHEQRHEFSRVLARRLLSLPGVRSDADPRRFSDVLYSCVSIASYMPLVLECGWSVEEWKKWVLDIGARELFEDHPSMPG